MLETQRVLLRPFLPEDAEGLFEMDSNPKVHRYLGNKPLKDFKKAQEVVQMVMEQHQRNGIARWTAIEKRSGKYMGWSGIKLYEEELCGHINFYEVGYRFLPEFWGKGFATETARFALEYGFKELDQPIMYAMTHQENGASNKVLHKIGFKITDTFTHNNDACFFHECVRN